MKSYHVTWEIDVDAADEVEAAKAALTIQRCLNSSAVVFDVIEHDGTEMVRVDLIEL